MTAKQTLQPKLRFPEFEGDWEIKSIGHYIDFFSGIALKSEEISDDKSGISILRGINITEGFIRHSKEIDKYYLGSLAKIEKYLIKENDLVLGMDGSKVGKNVSLIKKEDEGAILIQRVARIRANEKSHINFIYQQIFSKKFHDYVDVVNTSSGIPHISSQQIKDFKIGFSSLQEQTKIANFLSSIDEKINLLKEKKALLAAYKKGIMQKIFNHEIRFKDDSGNDFEDWEKKVFKEIFSFRSTNSLSRDKLNYSEGTVKNIHYGDIHMKFKTLFHIEKENVPFINEDVSIEKIPNDNYLKNGDLVIADASEDYDDIGKSIEIVNLNNEKVLAGLHTFVARPVENKLSSGFIGYLMKSDNIKLQIKIMAQGTKVLSLSPTRFAEIKFSLPCLNEQTKIANFLSEVDEKIALVTTQIKDTQEYKKGLLQQMFI